MDIYKNIATNMFFQKKRLILMAGADSALCWHIKPQIYQSFLHQIK
jgi:hypothetical protein